MSLDDAKYDIELDDPNIETVVNIIEIEDKDPKEYALNVKVSHKITGEIFVDDTFHKPGINYEDAEEMMMDLLLKIQKSKNIKK